MENFTDEAIDLLQLKNMTESNIRAEIRQYLKKVVNANISRNKFINKISNR